MKKKRERDRERQRETERDREQKKEEKEKNSQLDCVYNVEQQTTKIYSKKINKRTVKNEPA